MGKGKENIKRVWMAQQKTDYEKKKQEDLMSQYQKEQEMLSNRALLGDEKAKLGLSFLYDAPPGMKKKEKEDDEPEYKFEWQRKYNAPREAYAKGDDTISDQPFGIEVRNIRCIKCRQWGHVNTDKICPLFGKNLTAEPPQPETSTSSLLEGLKEEGFQLKQSMLGRFMAGADGEPVLAGEDEDDPEVQFLKSLTPKQKKKLLKKLNKLQEKDGKGKKDKKKKKKSKKRSSKDSDSDSSDSGKKHNHSKSKKSDRRRQDSEFDDAVDYAKYEAKGARPKDLKRKSASSRDDVRRNRRDSSGSDKITHDSSSHRQGYTRDRMDREHRSRPIKREPKSSGSDSEDNRHHASSSRPPVKKEHKRNGSQSEKLSMRRDRSPQFHPKSRRPPSSSDDSSDSDSGMDSRRSRSPQNPRMKNKGRDVPRGEKRGSPPRYSGGRRSRSPVDRRRRDRSSSDDRKKGRGDRDDRHGQRKDRNSR
ncbi:hypothetical protein BaRGS_00012499 [Batillaria attramentaria]|uniref:CBF1-interacting co-repressor CIR N-terminal domain-containing protein n=1 Tax=Batillaria attramentaria TaxID=370345 RepID=A0ABD0LA70_9CAEN